MTVESANTDADVDLHRSCDVRAVALSNVVSMELVFMANRQNDYSKRPLFHQADVNDEISNRKNRNQIESCSSDPMEFPINCATKCRNCGLDWWRSKVRFVR